MAAIPDRVRAGPQTGQEPDSHAAEMQGEDMNVIPTQVVDTRPGMPCGGPGRRPRALRRHASGGFATYEHPVGFLPR